MNALGQRLSVREYVQGTYGFDHNGLWYCVIPVHLARWQLRHFWDVLQYCSTSIMTCIPPSTSYSI